MVVRKIIAVVPHSVFASLWEFLCATPYGVGVKVADTSEKLHSGREIMQSAG